MVTTGSTMVDSVAVQNSHRLTLRWMRKFFFLTPLRPRSAD